MDDFDYPMPKRETNWTLDDKKGSGKSRLPPVPRPTNRTDDIPGAASCTTALFKARQYTHRPDLFRVSDIAGATPKHHVVERNKPKDTSLNNRDIEHSYPESKLFSTPRVVDPLNPVYPLARVVNQPPPPPPLKHEPLKTDDIAGTRPKPRYTRQHEVNPLDYSDIPYSTAGSHLALRKRKSPSMALETRDIADSHNRSHRSTNPLEPQYVLQGPLTAEQRVAVTIGPIDGAKPREPPPMRKDQPLLSLRSDDVDGAKPTSHIPYPKQRRQWKNTCDISDISTKGKVVL